MKCGVPHHAALKNTILVLKLMRLHHTPPARQGSELLFEASLPVVVIEYGDSNDAETCLENPFPTFRIGARWIRLLPSKLRAATWFAVALARSVVAFLRFGRPRLIIAHGLHEQTLALVIKKMLSIPYVVGVHECFERGELAYFNRILFAFEGASLRNASLTLFPEAERRRIYGERYHLAKESAVVFNCPRRREPSPGYKRDFGGDPAAPMMAYVGGIGDINAIEDAIRATALIPTLTFVIAGFGDERYLNHLRETRRNLKLDDRIIFLGSVSQQKKFELLEAADLSYCIYRPFTMRARHVATASNKMWESVSAGTPVLVSSNEDFKKVIEAWKIGVCAREISPKAIADAVRTLLGNPQTLKEMREECRRLHLSTFNYEEQFRPIIPKIAALSGLTFRWPETTKPLDKRASHG